VRRTLPVLAAAASLAIGGVVLAGPAAAAPSEKSVHTYGCPLSPHLGNHTGWAEQDGPGTERRNVGGTCINP
jgi:hypothetical protein